MNIILDLILDKLKSTKGKGVNAFLLRHIFLETENYDEIKEIIDTLYSIDKRIIQKQKIAEVILAFTEDFTDAKKIFFQLNKNNITTGKKAIPNRIKLKGRYAHLLGSADTEEEILMIIQEMKDDNIKPGITAYFELIKHQNNYSDARKIFEKNILNTETERIKALKDANNTDALRDIYGVLYLKATQEDEIREVQRELKSINMSTEIKDYYYLTLKTSHIINELARYNVLDDNYHKNVLFNFLGESTEINRIILNGKCCNEKIIRTLNLYKRNYNLVKGIKELYNNTCQICGTQIELRNRYYSEVHHIHPLYLNGPDVIENMIVVCPNHHILLDKGAINIDIIEGKVKYLNSKEEKINLLKHNIDQRYLDFHNKNIANRGNNPIKDVNNKSNVSYGDKVVLINNETNEEFLIYICNDRENSGYIEFKVLNRNINENIILNNQKYIIKSIL